MDDLNDLFYFAAVVENNGFSAAARRIGIEKTRLSRRIAALETRLGVRLLQRTTRKVVLTEAGLRFHAHCQGAVAAAQVAYEGIHALKTEPSGTIRLGCPIVVAQNYIAPILPAYMALHPKVSVFLESTDRAIDLIEERFDITLKSSITVENSSQLVSRELGRIHRIAVASPAFLNRYGRIDDPRDLVRYDTICRISDIHDDEAWWSLWSRGDKNADVKLDPKLITSDLRVQFETVIHGIGVALLPEPFVAEALRSGEMERVLPEWSSVEHIIHLLYPTPRGMLPSVRSLIDYLLIHIPAIILQRSV